jgi:Sel1 repeat
MKSNIGFENLALVAGWEMRRTGSILVVLALLVHTVGWAGASEPPAPKGAELGGWGLKELTLPDLKLEPLEETKLKAQQGESEAQYQLGFRYQVGREVTTSPQAAMKWFRQAAQQGHARAQWWLDSLLLGSPLTKGDAVCTFRPFRAGLTAATSGAVSCS